MPFECLRVNLLAHKVPEEKETLEGLGECKQFQDGVTYRSHTEREFLVDQTARVP